MLYFQNNIASMKKTFSSLLLMFCFLFIQSTLLLGQSEKAIEAVKSALFIQQEAWNNGDIDAFMEGYWKSDNLQFIGSSGPTYGWKNTLEGYKKRYPDRAAMGQLTFDILNIDVRSKKVISLVGKFTLKRENDSPSGHFLLIWKKIKGKWLIVADHTS